MRNKKELFDLFRESEQQLTERPSSDVWRRLESRLDERKTVQKKSVYRQLMSIAAVAILLITIGLTVLLQQQNNKQQLAQGTLPSVFEDLSASNDGLDQPLKVVEFTRKHVSRLANPIEEGTADRKLIPKVN